MHNESDNKKRDKIVAAIVVTSFVIMFFLFVFHGIKRSVVYQYEYRIQTNETFQNLKFKGRIREIKKYNSKGREITKYTSDGRIYGIMCVELDYCNVDSFYVYNDMNCLRISNGFAIVPTNGLRPYSTENQRSNAILSAKYMEVNMNEKHQTTYMDSTGNIFSEELDFPRISFSESQFNAVTFECMKRSNP